MKNIEGSGTGVPPDASPAAPARPCPTFLQRSALLSSPQIGEVCDLERVGNARFRSGELEVALASYSRAIELLRASGGEEAERLPILLANRALCEMRAGDLDGAEKDVRVLS